ncbi:MAG: hypothetical protein PHD04_03240 [Candidatus Pacebacteria bacterium]|nr:hypothetical protein [Candidatus Paceibacterota bacterium]
MKLKVSNGRKDFLKEKALRIQNILNATDPSAEDVYSTVLDLVFLLEQIIKIRIGQKNLLLIYKEMPKNQNIKKILNHEAVEGVHTLQISAALELFKILYPKSQITKGSSTAGVLIESRNELYHHVVPYKKYPRETLLKLSHDLYSIQLSDLKSIIGEIPPIKNGSEKISREEVANLFKDLVRQKMSLGEYLPYGLGYSALSVMSPSVVGTWGTEKCPRCGMFTFSEKSPPLFRISYQIPGKIDIAYYQCTNCHLELTPEEYSVAKEIMREQGGVI